MTQLKKASAVAVIAVLVLGLAACPKERYRRILEAENAVAQSIGTGASITTQLYDGGVIDRSEKNAVAGALLQANTLLSRFNEGAKRVHAAGGSVEQYIALADELSAGLKELNAEGKLGFKSEAAKTRVDSIFVTIQASAETLKLVILGESR